MAISICKGAETRKFNFGEHHGRNIRRVAMAALDMLRKQLKQINNDKPVEELQT